MGASFREAVLSDPGQFVPPASFAPPHLTSEPVFARVAERVSAEAVTQALGAYADHLDRTGIQDPSRPFRVEEFQRFLPDASALQARLQIAVLQDADARAVLQERRAAEARQPARVNDRRALGAETAYKMLLTEARSGWCSETLVKTFIDVHREGVPAASEDEGRVAIVRTTPMTMEV